MSRTVEKSEMLALSVRAVWAECMMRGTKVEEYRSRSTNVRGRVWLYASLTRYTRAEEEEMSNDLDVDVPSLPRGKLIGSIEIVGVRKIAEGNWAWLLARPRRAKRLVAPKNQALPTFFKPGI